MKFVASILKMMPVWFGIGFLGPVLAEVYLRTPLHSLAPIQATSANIYAACMIIGGLYGVFALRFGRWI
tara:strand:+ start:579 stop:785 length:207 start_codon:yes stop_codon:yes gene_type:complete